MEYLNWRQQGYRCTLAKPPPHLKGKVQLLEYFFHYMKNYLAKMGGSGGLRTAEEQAHPPHLVAWFRMRSAIVFHLSDGTVQVNFFQDHSKIILCPSMDTVSYIDRHRDFSIYQMETLLRADLAMNLVSRLRYSRDVVKKLATPGEPRMAPPKVPGKFTTSTPIAGCKAMLGHLNSV